MSSFSIQNKKDLDLIFNTAYKLRENTPYSFRILINYLKIFVPYSKDLKELYLLYQPDRLLTIPIFSSEVIYITSNFQIDCPDDNCINFKKSICKLKVIQIENYLDKINICIITKLLKHTIVSSVEKKGNKTHNH